MITAFGTPFLLQERTLYSISDYQTGRCLCRSARLNGDRYRTTSRKTVDMYNTSHIKIQKSLKHLAFLGDGEEGEHPRGALLQADATNALVAPD